MSHCNVEVGTYTLTSGHFTRRDKWGGYKSCEKKMNAANAWLINKTEKYFHLILVNNYVTT